MAPTLPWPVPSEAAQSNVVGMMALGGSMATIAGLLVLEASTATGTRCGKACFGSVHRDHSRIAGSGNSWSKWCGLSGAFVDMACLEPAPPSVVGMLAWGACIATTSAVPVLAASTATGRQAEVACSEQGEWALARSLFRRDRACGWHGAGSGTGPETSGV